MPLPLPTIAIPSQPTPRTGLLTAAVGPLALSDTHAQTAGAQWEAESCTAARLYPTACETPPYDAFQYDPREALRQAYAFNVYASEVCTPVGTSVREAHARVNRRLLLGEQAAVEQALWGGNGSNVVGIFETMFAEVPSKVTVLADSANPVEAVSLLEQTAASSYDGPTFIHARPRMAAYLAKNGLIDEGPRKPGQNPALQYSHFGSAYVFGSGYSGEETDGTDPTATVEAMYVTGRIFVWRTDVVSPDNGDALLDRTTNQRSVFALRTYVISVECLAASTAVTR